MQVQGNTVALLKGSAPELEVSSWVGAMEGSIRQKTVIRLKGCNRAVQESLAVGLADSSPCSPSLAEVLMQSLPVIEPSVCRRLGCIEPSLSHSQYSKLLNYSVH